MLFNVTFNIKLATETINEEYDYYATNQVSCKINITVIEFCSTGLMYLLHILCAVYGINI